jgi:hypothetical protein
LTKKGLTQRVKKREEKQLLTKSNHLLSDLMAEQNADNPDKGAVFRWCINSDGEDNISLELLSLLASLAAISGRPTFKRDTCPGQKVYGTRLSWECEYNLPIYGPKPTLFSPNPKKTIQSLSEDKQKLGRFIKGNKRKDFPSL